MEIITLTKDNLEKEHICCAISSNKDCQVASKKQWISKRLDDGLVFKKCDVRGKCFIEYIPAEKAWAPIEADGYMYINCLWVSGQFAGKGNANLLLLECIKDSRQKGKKGIVILSSKKKLPFLSDPKFLRYKEFVLADTAEPSYELYYLPFEENAPKPRFKEHVKTPVTVNKASFCTIQINVHLQLNMFRLLKMQQSKKEFHLRVSFLKRRSKHKMRLLRLPHIACFTMVNFLQMKYCQRKSLRRY